MASWSARSTPERALRVQSLAGEIREFKHDVYGRRQMAKITSGCLFFSCHLEINHTKMEKCLLLFTANTNVLIPLYRVLKTDNKSFIFALCRKRHT